MSATKEKTYLKWYQKLAYGAGDLASNCSYGLVSSFVLLYLTGTLGLDSAIIGSLMLASKVLDGISDVIFGTLIDRTHSKLGKARPWMLFGQVGVSLCLFLLFAIPAGSTTMQYIYFFIVYTALNAVFYTANGIAYSSLVALITKNNNERVQLGSFRFMFAVVTNIFMGFAVTGMVEKFGSGAAGWRTTALIFAIVGLVVNTISCLAVKELPEEELSGNTSEAAEEGKAVAEEKKHGFAETAKILVHNKYYLMILAIYEQPDHRCRCVLRHLLLGRWQPAGSVLHDEDVPCYHRTGLCACPHQKDRQYAEGQLLGLRHQQRAGHSHDLLCHAEESLHVPAVHVHQGRLCRYPQRLFERSYC